MRPAPLLPALRALRLLPGLAGLGFGLAALPTGAGMPGPAGTAPPEARDSFDALPSLEPWLGRQRVLVLDTPAATHPAYQAQAAALLPQWPGLIERDLHVITREGARAFRVRLVGKDGGVKLDTREPVAAEALFALIDAMPMRREEIRGRPEGK